MEMGPALGVLQYGACLGGFMGDLSSGNMVMTMTWQDVVVWAFGLVLAAVVVWRLVRALCGKRPLACGSCSRDCPMRRHGGTKCPDAKE